MFQEGGTIPHQNCPKSNWPTWSATLSVPRNCFCPCSIELQPQMAVYSTSSYDVANPTEPTNRSRRLKIIGAESSNSGNRATQNRVLRTAPIRPKTESEFCRHFSLPSPKNAETAIGENQKKNFLAPAGIEPSTSARPGWAPAVLPTRLHHPPYHGLFSIVRLTRLMILASPDYND